MHSIKIPTAALLFTICALPLAACSDDSSDPKNPNTSTTSQADAGQDTQDNDTTPDVVEDTSPPPTPESYVDAVDAARYEEDLRFTAQIRPPGSPHWQAVQDRCAEVFENSGFTVERHRYEGGVNVIGVKAGTTQPNSYVVVSAHYDHIAGCEGADDNASGVAGVLEAARALGGSDRFEHTLVVACWDQEELGLSGSRAWAERTARQGRSVHASFVLEGIAYATSEPNTQTLPLGFSGLFPDAGAGVEARNNAGDFITVVTDDINPSAREDFLTHAAAVGLPSIPVTLTSALRSNDALADLRRSDHDVFWTQGWSAMMLTDTANFRNPNYHCFRGQDSVDTLNIPFAVQVTRATIGAAAQQATPTNTGQPSTLDTTTDPTPPTSCSPTTQEGCANTERCVLAFDTDGHTITTCISPAPDAATLGERCEVLNGFGDDTCETGTGCVFWHLPRTEPQIRECHSYCDTEHPCPSGEDCIRITGSSQDVGLCAIGCDPMTTPSECPDGTRCLRFEHADPARNAFMCLRSDAGQQPLGAECSSSSACVDGTFCLSNVLGEPPTCTAYCKNDNDCAEGELCASNDLNTQGVGWCRAQ